MSGAVVVFVKTPGLSPVKTRLAVKLGQENAEVFHLASSNAVASIIKSLSQKESVTGYYAVAEELALKHQYWQDMPCIWQGEGGLGERMASVYKALLKQYEYVILVGADIPQMTRKKLQVATTWLQHAKPAKLAFAPSDDGGFWLFGGNCKVPSKVWTDVIYSEVDTGINFLRKIKTLGDIKILESLNDIDEADDLIKLQRDLNNLSVITTAQEQLSDVVDNLIVNTFNLKQTTYA